MSAADIEQGTAEWRQCRVGFVTASRIVDVMRKPRRGQKDSTTRKAYIAQVISERLSGKPQEQEFESYDTRRGTLLEPRARAEYELKMDAIVNTVGFIEHPTIRFAGCSPDGLIGDDGMCQIKAPRSHVHMDYVLSGIVPIEHRPQMYFEMACTGRQWNDFVSYDQNLCGHELFVKRLKRDEAEIEAIETEVSRFLAEVEETMARLQSADKSFEEQLRDSIAAVSK